MVGSFICTEESLFSRNAQVLEASRSWEGEVLKAVLGFLATLFLILPPFVSPGSFISVATPTTILSVYSESAHSSSIIDPYLVPGNSFNVSVLATNLPSFSGTDSGGVSGFDITLSYNSTVLRPVATGFSSPRCPLSEDCVFDLPANDTVVLHKSIDSPTGTTRISVISLGPSHRPDLSILQGQPAVLFRVTFVIAGRGLAPVRIQRSVSELTSFSSGCGDLIPFDTVDLSFDNRAPFTVSATPPSASVHPGQSLTITVNVTLVNTAGYGVVNLTISNYVPPLYTASLFSFSPKSGSLNSSINGGSFTSQLTIHTNMTTPPGTYTLTIIGVIPVTGSNPNHWQQNLDFPVIITQQYAALPATGQSNVTNAASPFQNFAYTIDNVASSLLASFTTSPDPQPGSPVSFVAVAVWCQSPPYSINWSFGDGFTAATNPVSHSYTSPGTYNVTFTVTDNTGNSYSSTQQVVIPANVPQPGLDPVATASLIALLALLASAIVLINRRKGSRKKWGSRPSRPTSRI